jgi:uncharacterized protein with NRDE domain
MCVLTYLPLTTEGFIFTHNRDESSLRPKAIYPKQYFVHNQLVIYPKDSKAGGTWVATSSEFSLCLLNGAFESHSPTPPYRQSRGQVILDFFGYHSFPDFLRNYDFNNIEPFTLIVMDTFNKYELTELRWDGKDVFINSKDNQKPHIWSSATLYNKQVRQAREGWFSEWIQDNIDYSGEDILKFHHNGGNGDTHNSLKMNRNDELLTQCITQIRRSSNHVYELVYQDLLANQEKRYSVF